MSDFNPNSQDAVLAKILEKLSTHGDALQRIEENQTKANLETSARITQLEHEKWYQRGVVAAVTVGVATGFEWVKSKW